MSARTELPKLNKAIDEIRACRNLSRGTKDLCLALLERASDASLAECQREMASSLDRMRAIMEAPWPETLLTLAAIGARKREKP
jgi:hypothetical protein